MQFIQNNLFYWKHNVSVSSTLTNIQTHRN
jgi:hypothetical protein